MKYDEIMSRISTTTDLSAAKDCDIIIEAIVENIEIKTAFYKNISHLIKPEAIFASNTSSLPITSMALASGMF